MSAMLELETGMMLLGQVRELDSVRVCVFITSHPFVHRRSHLAGMSEDIHGETLHKVYRLDGEGERKDDIPTLIEHKLCDIPEKHKFRSDWPDNALAFQIQIQGSRVSGTLNWPHCRTEACWLLGTTISSSGTHFMELTCIQLKAGIFRSGARLSRPTEAASQQ